MGTVSIGLVALSGHLLPVLSGPTLPFASPNEAIALSTKVHPRGAVEAEGRIEVFARG